MKTLPSLAVLSLAAAAQADSIFFTISNTITPEQPLALVTAWAEFDANQYAFCAGAFEVHVSEPEFSAPHRLLKGPGTFDGWLSPDGTEVTGINVGQLQGIGGIFADASNPIELWCVTWSTEDFSPRTVDLWTSLPSRWDLYTSPDGTSKSFLDQITAGHGAITIIPEPWAGPVVVGFVRGGRRRRER